jgi:hypothetical protein
MRLGSNSAIAISATRFVSNTSNLKFYTFHCQHQDSAATLRLLSTNAFRTWRRVSAALDTSSCWPLLHLKQELLFSFRTPLVSIRAAAAQQHQQNKMRAPSLLAVLTCGQHFHRHAAYALEAFSESTPATAPSAYDKPQFRLFSSQQLSICVICCDLIMLASSATSEFSASATSYQHVHIVDVLQAASVVYGATLATSFQR